jgi:hypothetical protein
MRLGYWRCGGIGLLTVVCACGGGKTGGAGEVGATPSLTVAVTGQGSVTSADGAVNCSANCATPIAMATALHLDARPAVGMQFTGWTGACSGTAGCDLTIAGDSQVGASFAAASQVTVQVQLVGAGTGRVTSSPAGIDCPGACVMAVASGTVVTITPAAEASAHFEGFGGGCEGTSCVFAAGASTRAILANFSAATGPCAGISAPAVSAADLQTFDATDDPQDVCAEAGTDQQGILYVWNSHNTFMSNGHTVQGRTPIEFLASGFTAFPAAYQSFAPDGSLVTSTTIENVHGTSSTSRRGGSQVTTATCDAAGTTGTIQIFYFDDANQPAGTATVDVPECIDPSIAIAVLVDEAGLTLITYMRVTAHPRRFAARWIDASGRPVTDWFDAGPADSKGTELLRPLIGGGAALNNSGPWIILPSGKAQSQPQPAFLASRDFTIVLGGKAYAMLPPSGYQGTMVSTLVAPSGETCGQLPSIGDAQSYLYVGRDGTLIAVGGANLCTARYYPHLLK